jgi:tripartite-type tricarboxylate transporter receptor subunit TctC
MKKILFACAMLICSTAWAQTVISIVWPFGMGDTQAQYSRSLVEELNRTQNKYKFVLENRPGAGATIGAKWVGANSNAVLSTSTAFFVRPNFYPEESHRVADFQPLMTQCAAPMLIVSKRYQTWQQISPDQAVSIGISGLGATSHLMATQIKKKYPNAVIVPYKGTREASIDAISGNLDMSVAFLGEVEGFLDKKDLYALGITGSHSVRKIPTLESQGFSGAGEIVNMHSLIVPRSMPTEQYQELRKLVTRASRASEVQRAYSVDYCEDSNLSAKQTNIWFEKQITFWKRLSQGVSLSK